MYVKSPCCAASRGGARSLETKGVVRGEGGATLKGHGAGCGRLRRWRTCKAARAASEALVQVRLRRSCKPCCLASTVCQHRLPRSNAGVGGTAHIEPIVASIRGLSDVCHLVPSSTHLKFGTFRRRLYVHALLGGVNILCPPHHAWYR